MSLQHAYFRRNNENSTKLDIDLFIADDKGFVSLTA